MGKPTFDDVQTLLASPAPAVLVTFQDRGSALPSPVWFRYAGGAFDVVVAEGDVKLRHLERRCKCHLTIFESVRPFRGVEVRGVPELIRGNARDARQEIAIKYLGELDGRRFADERDVPGVIVRLPLEQASSRVWDLSSILPD